MYSAGILFCGCYITFVMEMIFMVILYAEKKIKFVPFNEHTFIISKIYFTLQVGIATGWTGQVRFPAVQDFSLLHSAQTDIGAHPASYPMGTMGSFSGVKRQGREVDHSPPCSAEVQKGGAIPPLPLYVFMA
jgi:hypothetical protein